MFIRSLILCLAALAPLARAAEAAPPPALYAFGDSLSDAGNLYDVTSGGEPISPPYNAGRFSNGPVWVQDLSAAFGLHPLKPSILDGTDFAFGGAYSGPSIVHANNPIDLPSQFVQFTLLVPHPRAGALYTLWIGSNDLFAILADRGLSSEEVTKAEAQIVFNEGGFVGALAKRGARDLLIVTVPDLGKTPAIRSQGPAAMAAATALAADFNRKLVPTMQFFANWFGLKLRVVDAFALVDNAVAHPAVYGFKDVASPCWTGSYTAKNGTLCSHNPTVQDTHLFWDSIHPTARGHRLIATAAQEAIGKSTALTAN